MAGAKKKARTKRAPRAKKASRAPGAPTPTAPATPKPQEFRVRWVVGHDTYDPDDLIERPRRMKERTWDPETREHVERTVTRETALASPLGQREEERQDVRRRKLEKELRRGRFTLDRTLKDGTLVYVQQPIAARKAKAIGKAAPAAAPATPVERCPSCNRPLRTTPKGRARLFTAADPDQRLADAEAAFGRGEITVMQLAGVKAWHTRVTR